MSPRFAKAQNADIIKDDDKHEVCILQRRKMPTSLHSKIAKR